MLIESPQCHRERRRTRRLPPFLVIALLALSFTVVTITALLLLLFAGESVGWVRYRLLVETIAIGFAGSISMYNLAEGRVRR